MRKLLVISLLSFQVCAAESFLIKPSRELPIELRLIFQSMQIEPPADSQYKNLLNHAATIDLLAQKLDKSQIYFIVKSEIYKSILKFSNGAKNNFDLTDAKTMRKSATLCHDPFIKWMLLSLSTDADSIFYGSFYKKYEEQKSLGKFLIPETKKIAKKLQLLSKIYSKINPNSPDNLKGELSEVFEEILYNVEQSLFIMSSETLFDSSKNLKMDFEKMKYFSIVKALENKASSAKKAKTVEEILDDRLETLTEEEQVLPSASKEDWLLEESAPIDIKKLPKPSNDADWLQDI